MKKSYALICLICIWNDSYALICFDMHLILICNLCLVWILILVSVSSLNAVRNVISLSLPLYTILRLSLYASIVVVVPFRDIVISWHRNIVTSYHSVYCIIVKCLPCHHQNEFLAVIKCLPRHHQMISSPSSNSFLATIKWLPRQCQMISSPS